VNNADYVDGLIISLKNYGIPLSDQTWQAALACVGWPYVYSAWGAECTPSERRKRYNMTDVENIVKACQVLNGSKGGCTGCKWLPDGFRVRCFDCRGFTKYCIEQTTGFALYGDTCSTQWNHAANWCKKGEIGKDPIPQGVIVNLFIYKDKKWKHTGLYMNGSTCECANNVQYFEKMKANRWTHWAVAEVYRDELKEGDDMARPGYAEVTGKKVALRQEPSKSAKIITRINTGEEVKLEPEPEKTWDYVSYKGQTGWMMREFLQEG